jgi:hypothetical protein
VRSEPGRLVLRGPPSGGPAADSEAIRWAQDLSNDDVRWPIAALLYNERSEILPLRPEIDRATSRPMRELERLNQKAATRGLLVALENPQRFVAAHVVLLRMRSSGGLVPTSWDGKTLREQWGGLDVELHPAVPSKRPVTDRDADRTHVQMDFPQKIETYCRGERDVRIDPAQLPKILRQWHDLLDVPVFQIPYAVLILPLLLPPGIWCRRRWQINHAKRAGLCPRCGYDLRATKDRCPECGLDVGGR